MNRLKVSFIIFVLSICFSSSYSQFDLSDFSSVDSLNLVGQSLQHQDTLRLTISADWQMGAAWYKTKQKIQGGFETSFQFQISDLTYYGNHWGADGFAFVIQNDSAHAIGGGGGGMGYEGLPNSLVFEFDTWDNDVTGQTWIGDPNDNHISIHTNKTEANSITHDYSLGYEASVPDFSDGNVHNVLIRYISDTLYVYFDTLKTAVLTVNISIEDSLELDDGKAWVGFTASTGIAAENHDIIRWSFNNDIARLESGIESGAPSDYILYQNYPNPFNPVTTIRYAIPKQSRVKIVIHDISGQLIEVLLDEHKQAGHHSLQFTSNNLSSGLYLYRLQVDDFIMVRKMLLVK